MAVRDKKKQEEERRKRNADVSKRYCLPAKNRTVPLPPDVGISWLKVEPKKEEKND